MSVEYNGTEIEKINELKKDVDELGSMNSDDNDVLGSCKSLKIVGEGLNEEDRALITVVDGLDDKNRELITVALGSCKSMDATSNEEESTLITDEMEVENIELITNRDVLCRWKSINAEGLTSMNEEENDLRIDKEELSSIDDKNSDIGVLSSSKSMDGEGLMSINEADNWLIKNVDGLGSMNDKKEDLNRVVLNSCISMDDGLGNATLENSVLIIDIDGLGSMEDENIEWITDVLGGCKSMDGEGLTSMNEEDSAMEDIERELIDNGVLGNCESVDD